MKKTIILLALLIIIVQGACANGKRQAPAKEQTPQTATSQAVEQQDKYVLPVLGNFQITSRGDTITLVFFSPDNEMQILDMHFDPEEGMHHTQVLYDGTYQVVEKQGEDIYTIVFNLTEEKSKTKKTGRMKLEFFQPEEDGLPTYLATPLEGYDLGLPHDHTTELPISAFQAWD
ncbi:MAG: hypothetical protein IKT00_10145 [Prevotella sp.]|nr:hypothetical protein [Prevotella sp.]